MTTVVERDAARAILLTPEHEVLLLRVLPPEVGESFWIAPGGGLEPGETVEECLRRELREEVGLDQFTIGPLAWRRQHTLNVGDSEVLGFSGWGFPRVPPHDFALVARDGIELMFQRAVPSSAVQRSPRPGWAAYLRIDGGQLLELAAAVERSTPLLRKPERMPYGDVELAVVDPDGHVIVVSEQLPPGADVPFAREQA